MHTLRLGVAAAGLLAAVSCGGHGGPTAADSGNNEPEAPATVAAFTVLPVTMPSGATITPLGHISPVSHVLPTDHVGFYSWDIDHQTTQDTVTRRVYAPGEGVITSMLGVPSGRPDWKVVFRMTSTFYYYLDHILVDPSLTVGRVVHAGDYVGTTSPGGPLDLGAYDLSTTLTGFLMPARYPAQTLHCVSPWQYFTEPLRSQLHAQVRRVPSAPDRDGHIDYDIAGHLVGNWFHESVPKTADETSGPHGWPKSLAFVYDFKDPSLVRISVGGTIAAPGMWAIPSEAPRPETVSVATGVVGYRLLYLEGNQQSGLMLVEMLAPDRIRVEVFEGSQAATAAFDGRAQIYVR
jgi:hypothetical protein